MITGEASAASVAASAAAQRDNPDARPGEQQ
jgi:hypothetical protein